ncbi:hypothetical protein PLICRDRAFT_37706 [Plicaturopsis crispa FD-325 SS-3]|nr:hypothetical protein PLICRDRAFT_37706 [Plicaturopsis crispa FD-325 SS-3]
MILCYSHAHCGLSDQCSEFTILYRPPGTGGMLSLHVRSWSARPRWSQIIMQSIRPQSRVGPPVAVTGAREQGRTSRSEPCLILVCSIHRYRGRPLSRKRNAVVRPPWAPSSIEFDNCYQPLPDHISSCCSQHPPCRCDALSRYIQQANLSGNAGHP